MAENKRVVIVGIPGVGKTTVISRTSEILQSKGHKVQVVVFGTMMFEEARKEGLKNRDEMRKLSINDQRRLQDIAAKRISEMRDEIVIIDTHLFISTYEGYYPGLPMRLLDILKPTNMVMVTANAEEIVRRRKNDTSRQRDVISAENIQHDLDVSQMMVSTSAVLTGSPFIIVANNDNKVDNAARDIVRVLIEEEVNT